MNSLTRPGTTQSLFEMVHTDQVTAAALGVLDAALGAAGVAALRWGLGVPLALADALGAGLLFCATLSLLLTESFADDTIGALASALALVHLVAHDYGYVNAGTGRFSGTISLNAAVFTAVLLGSRLRSSEHVFAFVLFAIELFALFPLFQRQVKVRPTPLSLFHGLMFSCSHVLMFSWSHGLMVS
jgi:predicted membrane-bound spermidine synthase